MNPTPLCAETCSSLPLSPSSLCVTTSSSSRSESLQYGRYNLLLLSQRLSRSGATIYSSRSKPLVWVPQPDLPPTISPSRLGATIYSPSHLALPVWAPQRILPLTHPPSTWAILPLDMSPRLDGTIRPPVWAQQHTVPLKTATLVWAPQPAPFHS